MKAIIKLSSVVICMIFFLHTSAATELTLTYKYEYTTAFALKLTDLQNELHTVQIKDKNNFVIWTDRVQGKTTFGKFYNLENLPQGEYFLVVESPEKIILQPILANGRFLKIDTNLQEEIFKPVVVCKADYLDVNMLYFEKDKIQFQIRNKKGELFYDTSFHAFGSVNKRLNIHDLPKGKYQLTIRTNVFQVSEKFEVGQEKMLFAGSF